jgi:hypothetical protein
MATARSYLGARLAANLEENKSAGILDKCVSMRGSVATSSKV